MGTVTRHRPAAASARHPAKPAAAHRRPSPPDRPVTRLGGRTPLHAIVIAAVIRVGRAAAGAGPVAVVVGRPAPVPAALAGGVVAGWLAVT